MLWIIPDFFFGLFVCLFRGKYFLGKIPRSTYFVFIFIFLRVIHGKLYGDPVTIFRKKKKKKQLLEQEAIPHNYVEYWHIENAC